jgi:hypothetical protein
MKTKQLPFLPLIKPKAAANMVIMEVIPEQNLASSCKIIDNISDVSSIIIPPLSLGFS